jgi:tetratricopeptide (TPR) repeat protein
MRIASRHYTDEGHLTELERQLERLPDAVNVLFERACCLEDLGWVDQASQAYLATLQRDQHHFGALTNLGLMFLHGGDFANARALFTVALTQHPLTSMAHVNLAQAFREQGEYASAIAHYTAALKLDAHDFSALHGLALSHEAKGEIELAGEQFDRAFAERSSWKLPYLGAEPRYRVLLLVSARGGDIVSHPFLDNRLVETTMFPPEAWHAGMPLPEHDVVFNGIGDADRCARSLEFARALLATTTARVINDPARVLDTGRERVAARVAALPHVVAPRVERLARDEITADMLAAAHWTFPLLLRAPGYQAGRYFERVDDAAALDETLAGIPGADVFAIGFADARGSDGNVRKYRVLFVDGNLYPVHLAISRTWKVHYFSADMDAHAEHREEERAFLNDMTGVLGARNVATLQAIAAMLGLDYAGIDFSIDASGTMIVFEANATMAVYPPPAAERWAYRRPAYDAVIAAVQTVLLRRDTARVRA